MRIKFGFFASAVATHFVTLATTSGVLDAQMGRLTRKHRTHAPTLGVPGQTQFAPSICRVGQFRHFGLVTMFADLVRGPASGLARTIPQSAKDGLDQWLPL